MVKENYDVHIRLHNKKALDSINRSTQSITKSLGSATTAAKAFIGALAIREVLQFGRAVLDNVNQFQLYENQLRLITNGQQDLEDTMDALTQAAKDNRTSFSDTVDLFTKLRVSTEALGFSEERVLDVTGKLSKALRLAGADGNTASSVIRQFGQAMASGEVRGDEFRSLVEGLGPALSIMARESGITVGELRKMSKAGELTAEVLFEMLENSTALEAQFAKTEPTVGDLEVALGDAFDRAVNKTAEAINAGGIYKTILEGLIDTFDRLGGVENPFEALTNEQLKAKLGTEDHDLALKELKSRYQDLVDSGPAAIIPIFGEFIDTMLDADKRTALLNGTLGSQADELSTLISMFESLNQELPGPLDSTIRLQQELNDALSDSTDETDENTDSKNKNNKAVYGSINLMEEQAEKYLEVSDAVGKLDEAYDPVLAAENLRIEQLNTLDDALRMAIITQEDYDRILGNIEASTQEAEKKTEKYARSVQGLANAFQARFQEMNAAFDPMLAGVDLLINSFDTFKRGVGDAFADAIMGSKSFAESLQEVGRAIIKQLISGLIQIGLQVFVFDLIEKKLIKIRDEQTKLNTALGIEVGLRSILAFLTGGASMLIPGLADGGPARRNNPYLVGEAGPELFVPNNSGTVVPNDQLAEMSAVPGTGEVTVNFNLNVIDSSDFDDLLVRRRGTITSIINDALNRQGREAIV